MISSALLDGGAAVLFAGVPWAASAAAANSPATIPANLRMPSSARTYDERAGRPAGRLLRRNRRRVWSDSVAAQLEGGPVAGLREIGGADEIDLGQPQSLILRLAGLQVAVKALHQVRRGVVAQSSRREDTNASSISLELRAFGIRLVRR